MTKVLGGGAVVEHWTGDDETEGTSLCFTDPHTGRWRRVWRASTGVIGDYEGDLTDGVFRWEGRTCYPGGAARWVRSRMLPQESGALRHVVEHSDDFGRTWSHAITMVATRVEAGVAPESGSVPAEATGG